MRAVTLLLLLPALAAGLGWGGCAEPADRVRASTGRSPGIRPTAEEPPPPQQDREDPSREAAPEAAGDDLLPAEIATVGFDGYTQAPIVLLRELASGRVVPIWVGFSEARAIAAALHGVEFPRPMTHDLMADLLSRLDAHLEEVVVHDLKDGTYYGLLKLRVDGSDEPLLVDSRPSDGLALALRTGAAIRVARRVLEQTPEYQFLAPEAGEQVVQGLGLTVVTPTAALREELGLPERPGVVVTTVTGQAAEKGIRRGDLIVEVNGVVPESPIGFLDAIRDTPFTEPIRLKLWRDGEELSLELAPELPQAPPKKEGDVA